MLSCLFLRKKLYLFAAGDINSEEGEKMESHISRCPRCREEFSNMRKIINTVSKQEQLFLNEVFWRKFDERLALRIIKKEQAENEKTVFKFRLNLFPEIGVAAAVVCILFVVIAMPIKKYFTAYFYPHAIEQEMIETALLLDNNEELNLNHDEEAYLEEIMLVMELEQV